MKKGLKLWRVLSAAVLFFALSACSNPEGKSQALYETAQFEEQQMNFKHARKLYEEILQKYPEASFAEKARERLKAIEAEQE